MIERISSGEQHERSFWSGGAGSPVLLLHGGWAGARAHWSSVWEALAERHRIVAPDLPGISSPAPAGLGDYESYVRWLEALLDEQRISGAVVVGNSFGASLAYLLAIRFSPRCRALVMVDGFPPPELPPPIRWMMALKPIRSRALAHMRRYIYGEAALQTAFHDAANAPPEVRQCLKNPDDRRVEHMLDILLKSRRIPKKPQQPTLIVWGAQDRLPKAGVAVGRRLHRQLNSSQFEVIDEAGHMPQVEQPERFVRVLQAFMGSTSGAS